MSEFSVTRCTNGAFKVESEHGDEMSAKVAFHQLCASLWNEKSMDVNAEVSVLNKNLDKVIDEKITVIQPKPEQNNQPQGE